MRRVIETVVLLVGIAVASRAAAQQPEPSQAIGTWKLNPSKSTGTGSQLQARSRIHTIEDHGGGVSVNRIEQINADGSMQTTYYTSKADGTPYPMIVVRSNASAQVGTITITRVDAY